MSEHLKPQPWMDAPETRAVFEALKAAGGEARFVGGCVRDALLGRPVMDVDIATDIPPQDVMAALRAADIKAVPTGLSHGTVTAVSGGQPYEITTLRRDVETDGRRARVAFTDDWEEDAARRDFTFNALSLSLDGVLHDPFGGGADLRAGRVRFVGDPKERLTEDVLRLLRFFRFHAHYGQGALDEAGLAACRELAPQLSRLSAERVQAELLKLLAAPDPASVMAAMQDAGVFDVILPEAKALDRLGRLVQLEARLGDQWPALVAPDAVRRLAAVLRVDADGADDVANRLRLSNAARGKLNFLAASDGALPAWDDAAANRRALFQLGRPAYVDLVLLSLADRNDGVDAAGYAAALDLAGDWTPPRFPLSGRDVRRLGVPAGPRVGRLLDDVERWWIAEDFRPDREACLDRLRRAAQP
jgi:poly(A) polymerase